MKNNKIIEKDGVFFIGTQVVIKTKRESVTDFINQLRTPSGVSIVFQTRAEAELALNDLERKEAVSTYRKP